jgi:hypothetical protein
MLQLIKLLVSIGQYIPLGELVALIKASGPLPEDWLDDTAVSAWLGRIGVGNPLAALAGGAGGAPDAGAAGAMEATASAQDLLNALAKAKASAEAKK